MNEGTGFAAFALYNALKLHFTSKSYDYFKYNGKTNVTKTTFSSRKDKYSFYKLSRKYSLDELKQFYIANFLEGDKWVGEMTNAEGEDAYKKWLKRQQSLTYIFENDILYLVDHFENDKESIIKVYDGEHPNLLGLLMRDKVSIETVVIMNDILNFWPMWTEKIKEDIIWPIWQIQIEKYTPFVQYDKAVFKNILVKNFR